MSVTPRLIAGAMSGTSADGIDVALTRVEGRGLNMTAHLVLHHHRAYDPVLKRAIFSIREAGHASLDDLARIARDISLAYAACVNQALAAANLTADDVTAIAAHGQTLYHAPPNTIQWLDPAFIAAQTGCAVISDFRRADCAAGGQGAPLVPFADYILFRHPIKNRVLLNIGGIANLTYLPAGGSVEDLIAFDTGPGNCVSDWLCREHDPGGPGYDVDGHLASHGSLNFHVAFEAAHCKYVQRPPPKSTDGPEMIAVYKSVKETMGYKGKLEDELATACIFTVESITMSLDLFVPSWRESPVEFLVSGGGTRNGYLMSELRGLIATQSPGSIAEVDPAISHAKEAIAFALLAAATLDREPSNVPSCTGAKRRVVLGSITPEP
jgi:anhydro-N-acetylmuramic acid kinase